MSAKSVVICLALVLYAAGQDIIYYQLSSDTVLEITCTYSNECFGKDIRVKAESGYKTLITVKSVDINSEEGDFLLIKSGYDIDDGLTGRIFTHYINKAREYVSLSEEILISFVVQNTSVEVTNHEGFVVTVEHFGEPETTLAPIVTDRPLPTASEDDDPFITVNITINDVVAATDADFKNYLADLANDFITKNDFGLAEPISEDNIQIITAKRCPTEWPNSTTCTQITFAIPVFLAEESKYYGTYQLNSTYLQKIWNNSVNLRHPNYTIYTKEEHSKVMLVWIAIICGIVILWGAVYLASGYGWTGYILRRKKKEAEDKNLADADHSKRQSINSLSPHPLQHMPKFFDADVIYYNPDSPTVAVRNSPGRTDHHDDPRDTLDASNLNLRAFSFTGQDVDDVTET